MSELEQQLVDSIHQVNLRKRAAEHLRRAIEKAKAERLSE